MKTPAHIAASAPLLALAPSAGFGHALIAVAASVAIDADHLSILIAERAFTIRKIASIVARIHEPTIGGKPNRAYVDILYLFHTVEFNALLVASALLFHVAAVLWIAAGFAYHIAWDAAHHRKHGLPVLEWLFAYNWIFYRIRNKGAQPLSSLSE